MRRPEVFPTQILGIGFSTDSVWFNPWNVRLYFLRLTRKTTTKSVDSVVIKVLGWWGFVIMRFCDNEVLCRTLLLGNKRSNDWGSTLTEVWTKYKETGRLIGPYKKCNTFCSHGLSLPLCTLWRTPVRVLTVWVKTDRRKLVFVYLTRFELYLSYLFVG